MKRGKRDRGNQARPVDAFEVIQGWLRNRRPDAVFAGTTRADYLAWRRRLLARYRRSLGPWPARVPLRLVTTDRWDEADHRRERVLFDSCAGVSVPAYVLTPRGLARGERRPAILAAHGHGNGKDDPAGVTRTRGGEHAAFIDQNAYEYALEAVRHGYVVIVPDWCPFGERRPPDTWSRAPRRDPCNVTDMAWRYFGRPLLTQNIWDGMRAVDVLCGHPHVDPRRLGVIGLSFGGTMATHLLINEPRLRAGVVSGYVSHAARNLLDGSFCGAQHVAGLLSYGDLPDLLGLIAPKALLCEIGRRENCFHYPDMRRAYGELRCLYRAAGQAARLAVDFHPGHHRWSGVKAWPWLARWV